MRPEHTAPPEIFYNVDEAQKYSRNTRIMEIQATMSERAIEMLNLSQTSKKLLFLLYFYFCNYSFFRTLI